MKSGQFFKKYAKWLFCFIWLLFLFLGYATYLNIQFSLYNRLKYLQLNPKFSYSTFGVSISVDKEGQTKSHKVN